MTMHRAKLNSSHWTSEEISGFCLIKRFLERHQGDGNFRQQLKTDMHAAVKAYGIDVDPVEIRALWDVDLKMQLREKGQEAGYQIPESVNKYRQWIAERVRWRDGVRKGCAPVEPRWRQWRERQINRANTEMGDGWCKSIIFDTAAIELSKGCSVGCWFCGVDAPKLEDHLYHNEESSGLFRGVVETLVDLVGAEAASAHFLYWASDPLDNPDYEQYCRDFRSIVGVYPLMTTALALRDVERTKRVLKMLMEDDSGAHRFSVLTLKILDRIHEEFTPEELARVELVLLNKESVVVKANAGRFRKKAEKKPDLLTYEINKVPLDPDVLAEWEGYAGPGTIACVSGMLINLVERTVKLITPCKANERWPLGYVVFDEGRFDTPADLRNLINSMIEKRMLTQFPTAEIVRFRDHLHLDLTDQGFSVFTAFGGAHFGRSGNAAYFKDLGAMIAEGVHTADSIADRMLEQHGVFYNETYRNLDWMFDRGLLVDEPEPAAPPEHLVQLSSSQPRQEMVVEA